MRKVKVAILLGDVHLSHTCPPCRDTNDWYEDMRRYIAQVQNIAVIENLPIICSGDVFDKWNSPVELINFAQRNLIQFYSVPGQHDLPYHNYELRNKSAYGNLVLSGKIIDLNPTKTTVIRSNEHTIRVHAFPWGHEITPLKTKKADVELAVCHRYIWMKGKSYPGAPKDNRVAAYREVLSGYDAAIFGDNHKGFLTRAGKCHVFNNGTFIIRKSDETEYRPHIGILYSDGSIKKHHLDTSEDVFFEAAGPTAKDQFKDFIEELKASSNTSLDYAASVHDYVKREKISQQGKELLLQSIES